VGHVGNDRLHDIFTFRVESTVFSDVTMDIQCDMCVILALLDGLGVLLFSLVGVVSGCLPPLATRQLGGDVLRDPVSVVSQARFT
jgi:hypothetical protein